jgi:cytoskeletal protein CcmA (bactofilin family)
MVGPLLGQESTMNSREKPAHERVSLLGPKSILSGDFATTEELVILGQLDGGRVQAPTMTIGPAAHVTAEIYTDTIRIEGVVVGNVYARVSAIVHASATVQGSVHSPQLTVQEGATINGSFNQLPTDAASDLDREPHLAPLRAARRAR